jgi:hypothetical protein
MSFTKGPWEVFNEDGFDPQPGIEGPDFTIIVYGNWGEETGVRGATEEEALANARLIAAAPDLYIACKMLEDDPGLTAGANDVIKFALAKARGEAHVQ